MKIYVIAFAFIVLDYCTGVCKALATASFQSKIMREGLFHKVALLLVMLLGWLADYAQTVVDLGFTVPVGGAVCVYIIMMELGSSLENICRMNPDLQKSRLGEIFGGMHGVKIEDGEDGEKQDV
jgi:phage-related holin